MMAVFAILPFLVNPLNLPREKQDRLECERLSHAEANARHPGVLPPEKPRGDYLDRTLLLCRERIAPPELRHPRDESVLFELGEQASTLAEAATSAAPDGDHVWLVEANYPNAQVVPKLTFATKVALMRRGVTVSDRLVALGADDVDVITRMEPMQAYPAACHRYAESGSLRQGDVLLTLMVLDPRETSLHAGLCTDGRWTWLR